MNTKTFTENTADMNAAIAQAGDFAKEQAQTLEASTELYKTGLADLNAKTMAAAKANLDATFAFAAAAFGVKDVSALFALQQDFVKSQTAAFQSQAKELNELTMVVAKDAMKPAQEGFAKSVAQFNKTVAA